MELTINVKFEQQVIDTLGETDAMTLSYSANAPFPQTGDYIELRFASGNHPLKVVERIFVLAPDSMTINVLLDLPS